LTNEIKNGERGLGNAGKIRKKKRNITAQEVKWGPRDRKKGKKGG